MTGGFLSVTLKGPPFYDPCRYRFKVAGMDKHFQGIQT